MTPTLFPFEPWTDPNTSRYEAVEEYLTIKNLYHVWDENSQAWFDMRNGDLIERVQKYEKSWNIHNTLENIFPSGDPFRAKKHILLQFLKQETDEDLDMLKYTVRRYYQILQELKKQYRGMNKNCVLIWIMAQLRPQRMEHYLNYFRPPTKQMIRIGIEMKVRNLDLLKEEIKKWDGTIVFYDTTSTLGDILGVLHDAKSRKELIETFGKEFYLLNFQSIART